MNIVKNTSRFMAIMLALVCIICSIPMSAKAADTVPTWSWAADSWRVLDGTDIKIKISGEIMYVEGNGDLPDYDYWQLDQRFWHTSSVEYVFIGSGITSVGANFFRGLSKLGWVNMYTSTFIEDYSSFQGIAGYPKFRIVENGINTKYIGNIPYTSMDSIAKFAYNYGGGASFIMDTPQASSSFASMTNPGISNVYYSSEAALDSSNNIVKDANGNNVAPWTDLTQYSKAGPSSNIVSRSGSSTFATTGSMKYQGEECYKVFSAFLEDYTFACSLSMTSTQGTEIVSYTATEETYTFKIPKQYWNLGTQYRLIGIGVGTVYFFDDIDADPTTITFKSQYPTMVFGLVYKI